ncbi:MAG: HAD-IA family hydrolase [Bacilli bacterium]|nr:HAD-IA family hydrolase [Bacilli bacterium]
MKKCIVFDIDRTVIDSYIPEILSLQEAIMNVTGKKVDEKQLKRITSLTTDNFFQTLNLSDEEIVLVKNEWDNTYDNYEIKCFPKIKEVIRKLSNKGYIITIITSRTMNEFHELDTELKDILNCFKLIVTSDIIKKPKPDRESINYLCNQLQLNLEDIIYVGDSGIDKIFSQNCNIDFIPACWENKELENEDNACFKAEDLMAIISKYNSF